MFQNLPTNLLAFALVLGPLIFLHEAGHFFIAKLFRVRVLVFSLGFGKRLFGFRRGDTDYRVSIVPLGGYVRMAGDTPEEGRLGDPDEFLSKPKWQRFLILLAGPGMNLLIAIVLVAGLSMIGLKQMVTSPVIGTIVPGKPAARSGLQVGDRIVSVDGDHVKDFEDLRMLISMNAERPLRVVYVRKGQELTTTLTPEKQETDYGPVGKAGLGGFIEPVLGGTVPDSAAAKAGLRAGDRITAANGTPIVSLDDFGKVAETAKGAPITVDVIRGGAPVHLVIPAVKYDPENAYRGLQPQFREQRLGVGEALNYSLNENARMLRYSFITLGRLIKGESSVKELSGPGTIARISGEMLRQGWVPMLGIIAMISLQLGVMNLLPIPVLDGGHIMILLVEAVVRRDLSLAVKERITQVGFAALAALMIVVIYNDVLTNVLLMRKG
jgi:regulator of sigma E protease